MALAESIARALARLTGYANLWFAEKTHCQEALAFLGRMEQLGTEVSNTMLFFELWWKGIDDPDAQRLLSASGDNAYYLEAVRRFMPHTRSEAEEKAINLKNVNGVNALVNLYDMITNRFSFEFEVDDQGRQASTWHRPSSGREVLKCCAAWSTTWQFCDVVAPLEPLASSNQ